MTLNLRDIYESSHYTIQLGPHSVTLSTKGVVSGDVSMLFGNTVCIITAYNPSVGADLPVIRSAAENEAALKKLEDYLTDRGYEFYPASGSAPDGSHEEPSFAVFRMEESAATEAAREFGQKGVFFFKDGAGMILWTE